MRKLAAAALALVCLSLPAAAQPQDEAELIEQFTNQAWTFAYGGDPNTWDRPAIRRSGVGCVLHARRDVHFSSAESLDRVQAVLVAESCEPRSSAYGIAVALFDGRNDPFAPNVVLAGPEDLGISVFGLEGRREQIQSQLNAMLADESILGSALPPWPENAFTPALPYGIIWGSGADRELYEAIRAQDARVWCMMPFSNMLRCFAATPGRMRAADVFTVYGLGTYGLTNANDAVATITGERPALTPEEWRVRWEAGIPRMSAPASAPTPSGG